MKAASVSARPKEPRSVRALFAGNTDSVLPSEKSSTVIEPFATRPSRVARVQADLSGDLGQLGTELPK